MAAQSFTLVDELVQGEVTKGPKAVPSGPASIFKIKMMSTQFPTDATLTFRTLIEESFDGGVTWITASGYPSMASGGRAGTVTKLGIDDGLPWTEYAFDGQARLLRGTGTPFINGSPGSFDWGLSVTLA